jgi:hypothetical protein
MRWCFIGCLLVALLDVAAANVPDESWQRTEMEDRGSAAKQLQNRLIGVWRSKGRADEWHFDGSGRAENYWDDGQDFQIDRSDYRVACSAGRLHLDRRFHLDLIRQREGKYVIRPGIARFEGQQLVWVATDKWHEVRERQVGSCAMVGRPTTFSPNRRSEGIREVLVYEGKLPEHEAPGGRGE